MLRCQAEQKLMQHYVILVCGNNLPHNLSFVNTLHGCYIPLKATAFELLIFQENIMNHSCGFMHLICR